jgi:hypothetical protein
LRRRRAYAPNSVHVERDADLGGDGARDLGRLVVAARAQPRAVQRHGNQRIRRRSAAVELSGEQ